MAPKQRDVRKCIGRRALWIRHESYRKERWRGPQVIMPE